MKTRTRYFSLRVSVILISILFFAIHAKTNAQEGAYWMGLSSKNPGAIGTPSNWILGNFTSAKNDYFNKDYKAYSLFADFEINPKAGVIGVNFLKEELDYQKSFIAELLYAYNLSIKEKGKLSLGASLGMFGFEDDLTEYTLYHDNDPLFSDSNPKAKYLKSALGAFYHSRKLDLGLSYNFYSELESDYGSGLMNNTFTALGAFRFIIKEKFVIEPNILYDFASNDNDAHLGLFFEYDDLIWIGYNSMDIDELHSLMAGIDISRKVRLAYIYSFTEKYFDERTKFHEFVLGFKIK